MRDRPAIKPSIDLPLSAAAEELTGFEVLAIERQWGRPMHELGGYQLLAGTVWAYQNRQAQTGWDAVKAMTMRELSGYFEPEPDDTHDTEPDTELGKGSTHAG